MENLTMSIGIILAVLAVLYFMFKGNVDRAGEKAKYPVVLIISAHCVLKKINLKKHMMDIQDHVCIFGNQIPKWKGKTSKLRSGVKISELLQLLKWHLPLGDP